MRKYQNKQSGFMLAPLLYMLALGGIGAAVMFSGYSQVLRSNAEMSAVNTVRQQLNSAGQTLSAAAVLDAATSTIVQPPSVLAYGSVSDTSRLPTNYATVNTTGTPQSYGVIDTSTGVRQLDPWGKYYVYCRWENLVSAASSPSILVISAGPDGSLSTKCGDTAAVGDDRINRLTVAEAINRANVWQVNSASQVKFGIAANAVKVNDDGSLTANSLAVGPSASATTGNIVATGSISGASMASTGAITAGSISSTGAISGSTVTGTVTVSSGTSISAGTNITAGGSITATGNMSGANLSTGGTVTATGTITGGNLATGGTVTATGAITGASLTLTTTPLAITSGGTGANNAATARTNLAVLGIANNLSDLNNAATARTNLGLGTMATQNANSVAITGGTMSGVAISGGSINGSSTTMSNIPISSLAGYPGSSSVFLRGDGTWASAGANGANGYVQFANSGAFASDSNFFWDNTNKRLGIGVTPGYKLHVQSTVASNYVGAVVNSDTHGFLGQATTYGIVGYATSAGGNGILGQNTVTSAHGILGYNYNGVYGNTTSTSGHGVIGVGASSGSSSYGVYASSGSYNAGLARADGYSVVGTGTLYNNGQINALSNSGSGGYISSGNYGGTGSAAYFPQGLWANGATSWIYGSVYTNGATYDTSAGLIRDAGGGWVRTYGATGWYNGTYGGGMYMQDTTWVRTYNGKYLYVSAGIDTGGASGVACGGGLGGGFTFRVCGSAYTTGDHYAANFYHASDARLKKNIKPIAGLDTVMKMQGVTFDWKKEGTKSAGVIAQEIEKIMPEAVNTKPDGFKAVNYDALLAPVIEAIKDLKAMLDKVSTKVAELFSRLDTTMAETKVLKDEAKTLRDEVKTLSEELKSLHGEFTKYKAAHP